MGEKKSAVKVSGNVLILVFPQASGFNILFNWAPKWSYWLLDNEVMPHIFLPSHLPLHVSTDSKSSSFLSAF